MITNVTIRPSYHKNFDYYMVQMPLKPYPEKRIFLSELKDPAEPQLE
jgi:hypothetical protein